jgi:hypothetical protein
MQSVPITTEVVSSNPANGDVIYVYNKTDTNKDFFVVAKMEIPVFYDFV